MLPAVVKPSDVSDLADGSRALQESGLETDELADDSSLSLLMDGYELDAIVQDRVANARLTGTMMDERPIARGMSVDGGLSSPVARRRAGERNVTAADADGGWLEGRGESELRELFGETRARRNAAVHDAARRAADATAARMMSEARDNGIITRDNEAKRQAAEEEAARRRKKTEAEEARRKQLKANRKVAEDEAARKRRAAEDAAQRKREEEEAAQRKAEQGQQTRKLKESERKRKAAMDEAARRKAEAEQKRNQQTVDHEIQFKTVSAKQLKGHNQAAAASVHQKNAQSEEAKDTPLEERNAKRQAVEKAAVDGLMRYK